MAAVLAAVALVAGTTAVAAHAVLRASEPAANAVLDHAPETISLWFTERIQAGFSELHLLDVNGQAIPIGEAQIDARDPTRLFAAPGVLADGQYTVAWRIASAEDGHATAGSFSFHIGTARALPAEASGQSDPETNPIHALIRAINLLSLAVAFGSVGFAVCVWPGTGQPLPRVMTWLIWAGWAAIGVSTALILALQAVLFTGQALSTLDSASLLTILSETRFGALWLSRVALWLLTGILLWVAGHRPLALWGACGVLWIVLLTQSIYSHAGAAPDAVAAIAADWLHLTSASLWTGGLTAFALAIGAQIRAGQRHLLSPTGAAFSNLARVCMAALLVTGAYAAWLQVGSFDALLSTAYGWTLLVKLGLMIPLLLVAGRNLVMTARGIRQASPHPSTSVRRWLGAEIALALGIFAAVGWMTSSQPARIDSAVRNALLVAPPADPFFAMQTQNDLMAHLSIVPGYTGTNTFTLELFDSDGTPVIDASRVRMRFTPQVGTPGASELRPVPDGTRYMAEGANLSLDGDWQIRVTVARPGEFDTIYDFDVTVGAPPQPAPAPISIDQSAASLLAASLITGVALLAIGGAVFAGTKRRQPGPAWIGTLCCGVGIALLVAGTGHVPAVVRQSTEPPVQVSNAWMLPARSGQTAAVYLTLAQSGTQIISLTGAASERASAVEIHRSMTDAQGLAGMRPVTAVAIPPSGDVQFASGSLHLMVIGLADDIRAGDSLPLTLSFGDGSTLRIDVPVLNAPPF